MKPLLRLWTNINVLRAHQAIRDDDQGIQPFSLGAWKEGSMKLQYSLEMESCSLVPSATPWLIIAGHKMFECTKNTEAMSYKSHKTSNAENGQRGNLWDGGRGLSWEKWDFWRTKLTWIKDEEDLSQHIRDCAREAVDRMRVLESEEL